jgi:2-polyprenyl-3-methyl-5-hydroxy-6-metoxy-1,4-benzoquinol methylase
MPLLGNNSKFLRFRTSHRSEEHPQFESRVSLEQLKREVDAKIASIDPLTDEFEQLQVFIQNTLASNRLNELALLDLEVKVNAKRPVAFDSLDHLYPWGTARDNSQNLKFNLALAILFSEQSLKVLDVGCSGGGFVKTLLENGIFSVGIEGSDYSKKILRAEWATIPKYLHTVDATFPFKVLLNGKRILFEIVTAWEVLEHIEPERLEKFFRNLTSNLAVGGYIICSVSPNDDIVNGVNLHRTVRPREWWIQEVEKFGLVNIEPLVTFFSPDKWVRSEENSPNCFHLVLRKI